MVEEPSACLSTATRVALNVDHEDMNKFSNREGPYDDVKYCLQRIYDPLVESGLAEENKGYVFPVKMNTPGFDILESYPSDLWSVEKGVMRLSMGGSGTSGCIVFQSKTSRERFAVTLGIHNYAPWTAIATNFRDEETAQEIRDSYYGSGKRNTSSASSGARYISGILMAGRSVTLTFDQEVGKSRYPTEVTVR